MPGVEKEERRRELDVFGPTRLPRRLFRFPSGPFYYCLFLAQILFERGIDHLLLEDVAVDLVPCRFITVLLRDEQARWEQNPVVDWTAQSNEMVGWLLGAASLAWNIVVVVVEMIA